jgi:hypothetical protein
MDKEKLKKWAGYAGWGILGGYLADSLLGIILWGEWDPIGSLVEEFTYLFVFILIPGGIVGGVIAKKWWGALAGGFILPGLIVLIALWAWASMW